MILVLCLLDDLGHLFAKISLFKRDQFANCDQHFSRSLSQIYCSVNFSLFEFFTPDLTGVFSLKSLQVSRALLNILAEFNCSVICMVLILPLICSFSNLFSRSFQLVGGLILVAMLSPP